VRRRPDSAVPSKLKIINAKARAAEDDPAVRDQAEAAADAAREFQIVHRIRYSQVG
jgi:hypothetical protein